MRTLLHTGWLKSLVQRRPRRPAAAAKAVTAHRYPLHRLPITLA